MQTAYAYARFSSENQRTESIDAQLRAIREYCDREGIVLVRAYKDEAFSGRTDQRPQFLQMFRDLGGIDFVIVHKLDRFARNRSDAAFYRAKLKEKGARLVSVSEPIGDSPIGIITEGMLETINEWYSANLGMEVKKGMKENVLQGKRNGGPPPTGYRILLSKFMYFSNPAFFWASSTRAFASSGLPSSSSWRMRGMYTLRSGGRGVSAHCG